MIKLSNVSKQFKNNIILKDIDLEISRGQRVALVGSNGAGKTTLIRCLLGEYNSQGNVSIDGQNPREHREQVLSKIGFVPQLPPPLRMPVGQLVEFAASLCRSDKERMNDMAEKLGFNARSFKNQPFVKLSGGQKQKLLISIALGRDSEFLVMDEPAANLDPEARYVLFELLAEKQKTSAMLISSHRLDEVSSLVNRVVEMDQGQVVLDNNISDLIDISSKLSCQITVLKDDPAFAKTLLSWGFDTQDNQYLWSGVIAGPDRLKFLGMLSRYSALISGINMSEGG